MQKVVLITGASAGIGKRKRHTTSQTPYVAGENAKLILFLRKLLSDKGFDNLMLSQIRKAR